jgi:uncharacterized protein YdaU (DUF1376 family)
MAKSPSFQFYPDDFLGGTQHFTASEAGGYIRLLCHQWKHGSIPADNMKRIATIMGMSAASAKSAWATISDKFMQGEDGQWRNAKMERVRTGRQKFLNDFGGNGLTGAAAKWGHDDVKKAQHYATRSERLAAAREKGKHTAAEWEAMLDAYGRQCLKCQSTENVVKDHIVPIYQGGDDSIQNIQPLCVSCNSRKGRDTTDHRIGHPKTPQHWLKNASQTPASPNLSISQSNESKNDSLPPPRDLLAVHHTLFVAKYGTKPSYDGAKDAAIAKRLIERHGFDGASELLKTYFESGDSWLSKSGHGMGPLGSATTINKLIAESSARNRLKLRAVPTSQHVPCAACGDSGWVQAVGDAVPKRCGCKQVKSA